MTDADSIVSVKKTLNSSRGVEMCPSQTPYRPSSLEREVFSLLDALFVT